MLFMQYEISFVDALNVNDGNLVFTFQCTSVCQYIYMYT